MQSFKKNSSNQINDIACNKYEMNSNMRLQRPKINSAI